MAGHRGVRLDRALLHGTRFDGPLAVGQRYRTTLGADGPGAVDGTVEELEPPTEGRPGRFVLSWHVLYDAELADEHPGRVEWTVATAGDGLTRVRLVHGDLGRSPLTWAHVRDGWVWVLNALKTVLETGTPLPDWADPAADASADPVQQRREAVVADDHRAQGVAANNRTWESIEQLDQEPATPGSARGRQRRSRPPGCLRGGVPLGSGHGPHPGQRRPRGLSDCASPAAGRSPRPGVAGRGPGPAALCRGTGWVMSTWPTPWRREPGRCARSVVPTRPPPPGQRPSRCRLRTPRIGAQVEHDFAGYPG